MTEWKAKTCCGDCSCCDVGAQRLPAGVAPTCKYKDNRTYRLWKGNKCWGAASTCSGDTVLSRTCKPGNVYDASSQCPSGQTVIMKHYRSANSCHGDCSDCDSPTGWFREQPYCVYKSDEKYIFLEGNFCYDRKCYTSESEVIQVICG